MSHVEANEERWARGLLALTDLECDLLDALENFVGMYDNPIERRRNKDSIMFKMTVDDAAMAISKAYGGKVI